MAKLVTIGDSLTQGFSSFAIHRTDQSYPALIARALHLAPHDFRQPDFRGAGGLPFNLETALRSLKDAVGAKVSALEWPKAILAVTRYLNEVEQYWERGPGSQPAPDEIFHNLAVWGFEAGDAYGLQAGMCAEALGDSKPDWFQPPSQPRLRTGLSVLNPARTAQRATDTQLSLAERIKEQDGAIEHLVVWLGANNCLGTVVALEVKPETDRAPGPRSGNLLWSPRAFAEEYSQVAKRVAAIGAQKVFVATVPHVVIPPLTHGFMADGGPLPEGEIHYDHYIYTFGSERDFDPHRDPNLSKADAAKIDGYIDEYNHIVRRHAELNGWHVVDICQMLDRLAWRRNHGKPSYPLPDALRDLDVRFFRTDQQGRRSQGGLFGLDGIHPTACGYAIIAHEFIQAMRASGTTIDDLDFAKVRREDSLVSDPPQTIDDVRGFLERLERRFHLLRFIDTRELVERVA
jgi:lysophospholipase L1-like esterase